MKANKMKSLAFALASMSVLAAPAAHASVLSSYLTMDGGVHHTQIFGNPFQGGGEDLLQDDSLSAYVDADCNSSTGAGCGYTVGDYIYGMITLSEIDASLKPSLTLGVTSQIAILFSVQISSITGSVINLAPVVGGAYDLGTLLDSSINAGADDKTIGVIVSTTTGTANPINDPLNWSTANWNNNSEAGKGYTNTNNWYQEAVVGLVDADDFFQFSQIGTGLTGTERGAFTVQKENFYVKDWLDVDVVDFVGGIHYGDVTLDTGTVAIASGAQMANGWTLKDQSSFYVNAVPEPATIGLLGLGLLGMGAMIRRRKA